MNRREFFQTAAAAPAAGAAFAFPPSGGPALSAKIVRLNLQHTWTTTMSSSQYRIPSMSPMSGTALPATARARRSSATTKMLKARAKRWSRFASSCSGGSHAVRQAHGRGLPACSGRMGWQSGCGHRPHGLGRPEAGHPLYTYFGLDPEDTPLTTFSIGIDTPEFTRQKTQEAADFPILKVKVGSPR